MQRIAARAVAGIVAGRRPLLRERLRRSLSRIALGPLVQFCLVACVADTTKPSFPPLPVVPLQPASTINPFVISVAGDSLLSERLVRLDLVIYHAGDHDTLAGTWARVDSTDVVGAFPVVSGTRRASRWQLIWFEDSGDSVLFDGNESATGVTGQLRTAGRSASAQLLALDLDSAKTDDGSLAGWFDPGQSAVLSIRSDDSRDSDRSFIRKLTERQLMGELAIITRRVGTPSFLRWEEVKDLSARGYAIVAHSRYHTSELLSLGAFAWELVGAKNDLLAHGLYTRSVAIPGSWRGASYLDSVTKAHSARGRLAGRFYRDTYAWVYAVPRSMPLPDSIRLGVGHITVDRMTVQGVTAIVRAAVRQQGYLQLLIHTNRADTMMIATLLDSIARMRDQGLIALTSSSVALAARRDGAPKLRAAGGGPLKSTNVVLQERYPGACLATSASLDSAWIALDPGCELSLTLRNPPQATAAALEGMWRAANGDHSLRLSLVDESIPGSGDRRTCTSATTPSFCSVRVGVLERNTTLTASVMQASPAVDRVWLNRFGLFIK